MESAHTTQTPAAPQPILERLMLPGGLGARETGLAVVLSATLPVAVGVAAALALRLLQMVVELACAAITPVLARRTR